MVGFTGKGQHIVVECLRLDSGFLIITADFAQSFQAPSLRQQPNLSFSSLDTKIHVRNVHNIVPNYCLTTDTLYLSNRVCVCVCGGQGGGFVSHFFEFSAGWAGYSVLRK